jgi:tRNA threonylcarbamoyl adenosine modification protein (Sua5/YciO/YrdC/YwlC family)
MLVAAIDEAAGLDGEAALAALRQGRIVVYPTETLYGLAADAANDGALERLLALKGRDASKPISVLVESRAMLDGIAAAVPDAAERLIAAFWPGPLTIVLRAREDLSPFLTRGRGTIGVRISSHPVAQSLVVRLGRPMTSTSANPGGLEPAMDIGEARRYFGETVNVYVDGGRLQPSGGSTVVDCSGGRPVVLREGAIPLALVERAVGEKVC